MKVKLVDKRLPMSLYEIIKFQINNYCFLNNVRISPAQLDTLAYLGMWGEMNISDFCDQIVEEEVFSNPQTVRNFVIKCVRDNLILRKGRGKKIICLGENIELISEGSMLLNMKVYYNADQSKESNK